EDERDIEAVRGTEHAIELLGAPSELIRERRRTASVLEELGEWRTERAVGSRLREDVDGIFLADVCLVSLEALTFERHRAEPLRCPFFAEVRALHPDGSVDLFCGRTGEELDVA